LFDITFGTLPNPKGFTRPGGVLENGSREVGPMPIGRQVVRPRAKSGD